MPISETSILQELGGEGGSNNNDYISHEFVGSLTTTQYDVYNNGSNDGSNIVARDTTLKATQIISIDGLTKLRLTNNGSTKQYIKKVEIYFGGVLVKELNFRAGYKQSGSTVSTLSASDMTIYNGQTLEFPLNPSVSNSNEVTVSLIQNKWIQYTVTNVNNPTFSYSGTKNVTARATFADNSMFSSTGTSPQAIAYAPQLNAIYQAPTSNPKLDFIINNNFDYEGLLVRAEYRFYLYGSIAYTATTSNYTVVTPDMTTEGIKTVTVRYVNKTFTYNVWVCGKSSATITYASATKTMFKRGEALTGYPSSATVVYKKGSDGTTLATQTVTLSPLSEAQVNDTYETFNMLNNNEYSKAIIPCSGTLNGENYRINWIIYGYGLTAISVVSPTTSYNVGDTISKSGLTAILTFGAAGSVTLDDSAITLTSDTTYNYTGQYAISAKVTFLEHDYIGSYNIYVNGIADMKVDVTACPTYNSTEKYIEVLKGTNIMDYLVGRVLYYKTYNNGTTSDWVSGYTGEISTEYANNITATTGNKTITFGIENKRLIYNVSVMVYAVDSLEVSGVDTKQYVVEGIYPTFDSSQLIVKANYSNGTQAVLTSADYTVSKVNGTPFALGNNEIIITYKNDISKKVTLEIYVEEDSPAENATITITNNFPAYVTNGYKVSENKNLVTVVVSETENGDLNKQWGNYELVVYDSNNNVVANQTLTSGSYTIHVKVPDGSGYIEDSNQDITITVDSVMQILGALTSAESNDNFIKKEDALYKVGETFDISTIHATKKWASGVEESVTLNDITDPQHTMTTSEVSETMSQLNVTICGISTTVSYYVFKLFQAELTTTETNYDITDEVDLSKVRIVKQYSRDNSTTLESLVQSSFIGKTIRTAATVELTLAEKQALTYSFSSTDTSCSISSLKPDLDRASALVTMSASVSEAGVTVTSNSVNLYVKAIRSVSLYTSNNASVSSINLNYGNTLNLIGYKIHILCNDDTQETKEITSSNLLDFISFDNNSVIKADTILHFSVAYHKDSATLDVTAYVTKISNSTFNLLEIYANNQTVYTGSELALSEITASVIYKASNTEVGNEITLDNENDYTATINGETITGQLSFTFDNQNADYGFKIPDNISGSKKLIVTYTDSLGQKASAEVQLTVVVTALQSLTVDTTNLVDLADYYVDDNLDVSGLVVTAVYNNGNTVELTNNQWDVLEGSETTPISKTKKLTANDNNKALYVKYGGITSSSIGTLTVSAKEVKQIEIIKAANKTTFTYGDKFNIEGLILKATYKGNSALTETITHTNANLVVSGVTVGHVFSSTDFNAATTETITLTFTDGNGNSVATTYTINEVLPTLKSLRLDTTATQLTFTDTNSFNANGLVMYAVYENGYEETVSSPSSYITNIVQGQAPLYLDSSNNIQVHSNGADYGEKTLTLSYTSPYDNTNTKTTSYNVNILTSGAIQSVWLEFDEEQAPFKYLVGEKFTAKGVKIKWVDVDGNTGDSTDFETTPTLQTLFRKAQRLEVTVVFTRGSFSSGDTLKYDIQVLIPNQNNVVDTNDYKIAIGNTNGTLFTSMLDTDNNAIILGLQDDGSRIYPIFHENKVAVDTNSLHTDTYGYNVYTGNDLQADCIGYMDLGLVDEYGNNVRNAHIILFEDITNPIDGDNNVEVTFPHYVPEYANKINKCKFGIIYNKHLFVSGNVDFKNMDWHSESSSKITDLTYFSDLDYCAYGSDDTAVVGYDVYRDGELIVFKEPSRYEATLYRRVAQLITAIDYQGNTIEGNYEDAYPCYDINFNGGDGAISNVSIINFVGDTLFLTKNGLKVLASKDTTYNKEKIVYDVSTAINNRITIEDVENIHLYTYKERLLLKTNRGVYVGEYNLRNEENNEYEWYFIGNINADLFFEYDDELYFIDNKGNVCKFTSNDNLADYKDKPRVFIGIGGTLLNANNDQDNEDGFEIDANNDYIIVSKEYAKDIENGKDFHLITTFEQNQVDVKSVIHASLGNFINDNARINAYDSVSSSTFDTTAYVGIMNYEENTIEIKPYLNRNDIDFNKLNEVQDIFYSGQRIYLDNIVGTNPVVYIDTPYVLEQYKDSNNIDVLNKYYINDIYGHRADLTGVTTLRISIAINELAVTKITECEPYNEDGAMKFKLLGLAGKVLDLIYYNGRDDRYSGVITTPYKVQAYYMTRPFDLGTQVYEKTIKQWSIINDTDLESQIDIGFISSAKQRTFRDIIETSSGSKGLDFGNFAFNKIQFLSDKLPHIYNRVRTVARVGFIKFIFKNSEDTNMVLTQLNIVYTINGKMVGGK